MLWRSGRSPFMLFVVGISEGKVLWSLVNLGIVLLLVGEIPGLFGQMAGLGTGEFFSADLFTGLVRSSYGLALGQRLGAAALLWVVLGVVGQSRKWLWVALLVGLGLAVVDGEASHAVGVNPVWWGLGVNMVHVAAMGVWVGGLICLVVLRRSDLAGRFGRMAAWALLALVVSGSLMALAQFGRTNDLLSSWYVRVLLVKLLMVAAAIGLVGAGLWVGVRAHWRLRGIEVGVLGVVMLLAGLLVTLVPPK